MSLEMKYWSGQRALKVPKLGFGTYQLKGESAIVAVQTALELGLRHIDTASIYDNEEEVGTALQLSSVPREDIFLTTKVWLDSLDEKGIKKSLNSSLQKLKTDYVDLLLIHWPNLEVELSESLGTMQELQKKHKLRYIGVSNFPLSMLKKAKQICPELINNQVEYHPLLSQKKLLEFVDASSDIFLTAYSPLMRAKVMQIQQIVNLAKKYKKTPSQITLKWLIDQKNVVAIFKSQNKERILENTQIFDFELDPEDQAKIFRLNNNKQRLIDPPFAPPWDN